MINNKPLLYIILALLPIALVSFTFKDDETNFNLEKKEADESIVIPEEKEATIRILTKGTVEELPLEEYIIGVVAGEMPASFDLEALKAQAVASRTYALYKKTSNNGSYDLTDNTNTQVYIDTGDMQNKWGTDFDKYYNKIKDAVNSTKGEVLTYDGNIIEAFYFAMSAGSTNDSMSVFRENRDYLQSVESIYDNESLRDYSATKSFDHNTIIEKLDLDCQSVTVDDIKKSENGYVQSLSVCSKTFSGTDFRMKLGLRSTNMTIEIGNDIKITTRGYGHGVGMSQYGANGYASNGYTYKDILKHYYYGTDISNIKNV